VGTVLRHNVDAGIEATVDEKTFPSK